MIMTPWYLTIMDIIYVLADYVIYIDKAVH